MAASVEELAFDLSMGSLSAQGEALKDVRARSATLLTASSIVTSFVGGQAIAAVDLNAITAAAVGAFVLTVLPAIYVVAATAEGRSPSRAPASTRILLSSGPPSKKPMSRSPKRSEPYDKQTVLWSSGRSGLFAWDSGR